MRSLGSGNNPREVSKTIWASRIACPLFSPKSYFLCYNQTMEKSKKESEFDIKNIYTPLSVACPSTNF